jgi:uncharacterized protein YwqG
MGIFSRLLGGEKKPTGPTRDVAALAAPQALTAVQAVAAPFAVRPESGLPAPRSWFLGAPQLGDGFVWPEWRGGKLDFLARLDLAEIAAVHRFPWLPTTGSLSFFMDMKRQPSGMSPDEHGLWAVVYDERPSTGATHGAARGIEFRPILTYPPADRAAPKALGLTDEEQDLYCNLELAQTGLENCHHVGGFQTLIQSDTLELESEFASNGLEWHKKRDRDSERGNSHAAAAGDWRLLFQIASDDDLGFTWGDGGNVYFMIRESDARAGRFDAVWALNVCH